MDEVKIEQFCFENKQSAATSSSSVSEGSCSVALKSPGICSPTTTASPPQSHRRTTGPIRRAKGGWTPEEVSNFILAYVYLFIVDQLECFIQFDFPVGIG
ncbi:hypothetical protein BVC80_4379g1 [Macleaya cordata]|uniref:Uncharacterized protein n=1 Tax=Macleaya cordata TaxID=56857 RepID=A0A200Q615_MACCD|nr:hypothetical protein BVC80_4379g1 [Macleaya cordata]